MNGQPEIQEELKSCLLRRDYVGYREQLRQLQLGTELERGLEGILRLRGGQEICDQALELSSNETAKASIRHLCEIWDVLNAYDVCEHVLIDLTMIGDFSYYTGMTFEGYAAELGFPVASGGRYDNLLSQFGRPAPATGFALKTTRILDLIRTGQGEEKKRILIGYDAQSREGALLAAKRYREQGDVVVTERVENWDNWAPGASGAPLPVTYKGNSYSAVVPFQSSRIKGGTV